VSGCASSRSSAASWYGRVRGAVVAASGVDAPAEEVVCHGQVLGRPRLEEQRAVAAASPLLVAGPEARGEALAGRASSPTQLALDFTSPSARPVSAFAGIGRRIERLASPAMRYGTAFHTLMQHAHAGARFDPQHWTGRLGLPLGELAPLCRQADALLVDSSLTRFFDPGSYERALNEWPFVTESGTLLRVDRLVEFPAEVWVLDYKTGGWSSIAGTPLEGEYRAQVAAYCNAVRAVFPAKTVYGLLLFADGSRVTIEECADE
jgi:ATP-dependent exoDNAse (exonuclease V) beta subunit